jgi:hypothetical protein
MTESNHTCDPLCLPSLCQLQEELNRKMPEKTFDEIQKLIARKTLLSDLTSLLKKCLYFLKKKVGGLKPKEKLSLAWKHLKEAKKHSLRLTTQ